MAKLYAQFGINVYDTDLNWYSRNWYDAEYYENSYSTLYGGTYQDIYIVNGFDYNAGLDLGLFVGGASITVDGYNNVTGGTVTGIGEYFWDGGDIWYLTEISLSAAAVYQASLTPNNSDDLYLISSALSGADQLYLSNFDDVMSGFNGNDLLYGYGGADILDGGYGNDRLYGGANNDVLSGQSGSDKLYGGSGADKLVGGAGNDRLQGDAGKDILAGGSGVDLFVFNRLSDSRIQKFEADIIKDFRHGVDRIDLRPIDASTELAGNNSFTFDGTKPFGTSVRGDIYFEKFNFAGTNRDYTMIYIDNDADSRTEMSIKLDGLVNLTAEDFLL